MSDEAAAASLQYLEAIKHNLNHTILDNGEVMLFPDSVLPSSIRRLAGDLEDIVGGQYGQKSLLATQRFGADKVQSVAFGGIRDFKATIKVGLLYSQRIVLWDILSFVCHEIVKKYSQSRFSPLKLNPIESQEICELASNILSLETLAKSGALAILPHPWRWSHEALATQRQAAAGRYGIFFSSEGGVLLAGTLSVAAKYNLHPYTITENILPLQETHLLSGYYFSRQNQLLQRSYSELLVNQEFDYLEELSIKDFYELIQKYNDVAQEIQDMFGELNGKTEQQWRERNSFVHRKIKRAIDQQNSKLATIKKTLEIGGPLVSLTTASVEGILAVIGPLMESSGAAINSEPIISNGIVVAFFSEAKRRAEETVLVLPGT